jgi:Peptidase E
VRVAGSSSCRRSSAWRRPSAGSSPTWGVGAWRSSQPRAMRPITVQPTA